MKPTTKLKRKLKKQLKGLKLARNYLILILLILGGAYYAKLPTPPIVSPIAQAQELAPRVTEMPKRLEWPDVAILIVEEFKDLGPAVTKQALEIAYCESGWQEKAINDKNTNGSIDSGVFQINSIHNQPKDKMLQAKENIRFAKAKFIKDKGWGAWVCSRK